MLWELASLLQTEKKGKDFAINKKLLWVHQKSMVSVALWTTLMVSSLFFGILICFVQLRLALRIIRAKTDVPVFNQLFVLCLIVSGLSHIKSCTSCFLQYLVDAIHWSWKKWDPKNLVNYFCYTQTTHTLYYSFFYVCIHVYMYTCITIIFK